MRLYLDTSVFGALFDIEPVGRKEITGMFFHSAEKRQDPLYVSDLVLDEISQAPARLRFQLEGAVRQVKPMVLSESPETQALAEAYVTARVVPARFRDDASHVAIASLARVDALVSRNFKHLINVRRKRLVHSVNVQLGYPLIDLVSAEEVLYE